MRRFFLVLWLFIASFWLISCQRKADFVTNQKEIKTIEIPARFDDSQYELIRELNTKERVAFLYYDATGRVHLWMDGKDTVLNEDVVKEHPRAIYGSLSYLYDGKYLYVSYWIKEANDKQVVFTRYDLKESKTLTKYFSTTKQALSPAYMSTDGKGNILLAWYDESLLGYAIAYLVVSNYGEQAPEKENFIHHKGQTIYEKFIPKYDPQRGFYIVYGVSGGKDFIKSYIVGENRSVDLLERGNRAIYQLYSMHGKDGKDYIVTGWYDPSTGGKIELYALQGPESLQQLTSYSPEEVKKYYYGTYYYPVQYEKGYGLLFHRSQIEPLNIEGLPISSRANIFLLDKDKTRRLSDGLQEYLYTQQLLSMATDKEGTLLVYSDNRYIFPSLMVGYIKKDGNMKLDGLIDGPSQKIGIPKVVPLGDGLFRVFFQRFDEEKNRWNMKFVDVAANKIGINHSLPPSGDMEKSLKKSTEEFTSCQVKNDIECIYKFFDPRYKSLVSLERQKEMERQLGVKIKSYKYKDVKLYNKSPIAIAKGEVVATIPEYIMGKPIPSGQAGERKYKVVDLWLYINGSWYYAVQAPVGEYFIRW